MSSKNYSNRKKQSAPKNSNSGVSGVILIVVSVFFLLCITFPSFSIITMTIRDVTLGLIGYSAYLLFSALFFAGILLLTDKRPPLSVKNIIISISIVITLIFLLQLITTKENMVGVSEYIDAVYEGGTIGGVICGIILFGVSRAITTTMTYVFLAIILLILTLLLCSNLLNTLKNGKKTKKTASKHTFNKGEATPTPMIVVDNNGLFVETIIPSEKKAEESLIITDSGKYDDIKEVKSANLSKYNLGKVEFEEYHKGKKETGTKADVYKKLFGNAEGARLYSYNAKPPVNIKESQNSYYTANVTYIPQTEPKKEEKPAIKPETPLNNSIAARYGLEEIAVLPAKKEPVKYVEGAILNGDEISERLKRMQREREEQTLASYLSPLQQPYMGGGNGEKPSQPTMISSAPYVSEAKQPTINTAQNYQKSAPISLNDFTYGGKNDANENKVKRFEGIINGDFYTGASEEFARREAEARKIEQQRKLEEARINEERRLREEEQKRKEEALRKIKEREEAEALRIKQLKEQEEEYRQRGAREQEALIKGMQNREHSEAAPFNASQTEEIFNESSVSIAPSDNLAPIENSDGLIADRSEEQAQESSGLYSQREGEVIYVKNPVEDSIYTNYATLIRQQGIREGVIEHEDYDYQEEGRAESHDAGVLEEELEKEERFERLEELINEMDAKEAGNIDTDPSESYTQSDNYTQSESYTPTEGYPTESYANLASEEELTESEEEGQNPYDNERYDEKQSSLGIDEGDPLIDAQGAYGEEYKKIADLFSVNSNKSSNKSDEALVATIEAESEGEEPSEVKRAKADQSMQGFNVISEVEDKSERGFEEQYRTGYYTKDAPEYLEGGELRVDESFRKKISKLERDVFAKDAKLTPVNQINIDDYLKSSVGKEEVEKTAARPRKRFRYVPPPVDLLLDNSTNPELYGGDCNEKARILEKTLESLKFPSKVIGITKGPAVTRYEIETTPGIPIKRVENCAKDIAYALASDGKIRIETPIPGRRAVGVEVPNEEIATVCLRDIISSEEFISAPSCLTLAVGKDITGNIIVSNLERMPHLLIAGATGTGKSVCLNSIITSILYKSSPEDVRLILIDPKRVEFVVFRDMPHLLMKNIITEPAQAINAFRWAKDEMERRYKLFSKYVNKNIQEFNNSKHVKSGSEPKMPYIVIIVDELSDLMMPHSNCRKELEDKIMSMAQKARAAGIHLILATQRPSVDVITGTIKANLTSRIAFAVTSFPDSKTIIDQGGAEALLGKGDMLYSPPEMSDPRRVQGAYISSEEVESVVNYVKEYNDYDFDEEVERIIMKEEKENEGGEEAEEESPFDPVMKEVLRRVIELGQVSTSFLQRRFSLGYARAARIMDQMEAYKFVSTSENSKPREIYITRERFKEIFGEDI